MNESKSMKIILHHIAILLMVWPISVLAEPEVHEPKICIGYHPATKGSESGSGAWGPSGGFDSKSQWILCPEGFAVFGTQRPVGSPSTAEEIKIVGSCCPLPAGDILDTTRTSNATICPDSMIATGFSDPSQEKVLLRCTAIHTGRYKLGDSKGGIMWGLASAAAFSWRENKLIRRNELPAAVRYGLSRKTRSNWSTSGCVGEPIGSVLVGKENKSCKGMLFRELQFAGINGDPPSGSPVVMFPKCQTISDLLSADARCVEKTPSSRREVGLSKVKK